VWNDSYSRVRLGSAVAHRKREARNGRCPVPINDRRGPARIDRRAAASAAVVHVGNAESGPILGKLLPSDASVPAAAAVPVLRPERMIGLSSWGGGHGA